jgi:hypothetical protein
LLLGTKALNAGSNFRLDRELSPRKRSPQTLRQRPRTPCSGVFVVLHPFPVSLGASAPMKCPYCHSLRHDLVIIGRVAATPLPENFATRLGPLLARLAECTSKSLNESASAFALRRAPPTLKPMEDALAAYNSEIAALRSEGLTLALSIAGVEQLFTLGFALEQMHQHLGDLERCMQEWAWPSRLDRDR